MNKQTLIRTLIIAVPVGVAALITGYFYRESGEMPEGQERADTQVPGTTNEASKGDQPSGAAPAPQTAGSETAVQDEESQAVASAEPQTPEPDAVSGKPSFDVVGVEPTGETVVAGRSEAGAIVALIANGQVVGKTIANPAGEWTIILDEPLKPGDYDVALEVHDQGGEQLAMSDQRVAISIPDGGQQQPLVVLNSLDGPSNILQKPEAPVAVADAPKPDEVVVAAAPASGNTEVPASASSAENVTAEADHSGGASSEPAQTAQPAAPSSAATDAAQDQTAAAGVRETTADTPSGTAEQAAEAPATSTAPETEPAATSSQTAAASAADAPATSAGSAPADTNQQVASTSQGGTNASEGTVGTGTEGGEPPVTVEAVESEEDKVYVAGTAEPGSSVRVYVGDEYQGEAKANSSGRWLLEGDKSVAEGNVEVRADVIAEDGKSVDARAAVTFEKQQEAQIVLTKVVASGTSGAADSDGADVKKALPVVIIRKGDNLWRISRRLYGDGIRYTTIYQANKGQIRDPDLIYPGQVFLTPEGDLNWPASDADNGRNG